MKILVQIQLCKLSKSKKKILWCKFCLVQILNSPLWALTFFFLGARGKRHMRERGPLSHMFLGLKKGMYGARNRSKFGLINYSSGSF